MFGLLGPNGAGKSTLMRILATLQEADSGTATLGRASTCSATRTPLRRVLGYLPQEFGLYPKVTAARLLDHFAQLKGIADGARRARSGRRRCCARPTCGTRASSALGAFSGGMKQRFGIAQALLGDPKLIIVDEPTAGLDPEERVRFHNLLAEIGENVIVILSTHIVADVADLCRNMAIIHQGQVLACRATRLELSRGLRGRIWQTEAARDSVGGYRERLAVISERLRRAPLDPGLRGGAAARPNSRRWNRSWRTSTSQRCGGRRDPRRRCVRAGAAGSGRSRPGCTSCCSARLAGLMMVAGAGGIADASLNFGGGGKVLVNSPYAIAK